MFGFISPTALFSRITDLDAPLIVDVCGAEDFAADPRLIPTALKMAHRDACRGALPLVRDGRVAVVVCQKGLKLSQGVAARLWAEGCRVSVLTGGVMAWHAAGLPAIAQASLPATGLWVAAPGPEAAMAQWLLARFAPGGQTLLIVPSETVDPVARMFNAAIVTSASDLYTRLGLTMPRLDVVIGLVPTLTRAAGDSEAGSPRASALALLDKAYREQTRSGADA